jgi:hypothetical protein
MMFYNTAFSCRSATIGTQVTLLFPQDPGNDLHYTKQGGLALFIILYHNLLCYFRCPERLVFPFFLESLRFTFRLCTLHRRFLPLSPPHLLFSPLSAGSCVARIPGQCSSLEALCMSAYTPHPPLTLEEVFPPTRLIVIHFWVRGWFWS